VFPGFYGAPDLNEQILSDGWLRTGDIGVFDDRLYLVGRKKNMISVSGFKVSPVEVEVTLETRAEIAASLVVGEPDDRTGERVVAYVVPAEGREIDVRAAQDHVRATLARYKVPREIFVVEELPATVLGKRIRGRVRI
jgi:long-chain acyl-CoA synthetase